MSDKYIRTLRMMALNGSLDAKTARFLLTAHDAEFVESQHPRGKGGKFVKKGSGVASGGKSEGSASKPKTYEGYLGGMKGKNEPKITWHKDPSEIKFNETMQKKATYNNPEKKPFVPYDGNKGASRTSAKLIPPSKQSETPREAENGSGMAGMIRAQRITKLGEQSEKNRVASEDSGGRFANKPGEMREGSKFKEGSAFNKPKAGKPTKVLPKGTGATKLSTGDLYSADDPKARHTINQYLDDDGNLTPEREALHAQCVDNLFAGKKPKGPGEKKTFTMFGGGSAAGKGGLSDPKRCQQFKSEFFQNGTPNKQDVATIDADELKKDIPEYREMQKTDPDNAASVAHEESSALAKRAMQAAFDNGYDCTLDGTGDGSVEGVRKKIEQARANGYEVNACYVTCPTDQAVKQAKERAKRINRNVKEGTVRNIHKKVSQIFPEVASDFDNCALFDTSDHSKPPVLIAECKRGGKIQIRNQALWDSFIAKGKE